MAPILALSSLLLLAVSSTSAAPSHVKRSVRSRNVQEGKVDAAPPGFEQFTSPLVLPAKRATGDGGWQAALRKAQSFVADLTIQELANLTTGAGITGRCVGNTGSVPRKNFPAFCLEDSPLGVRFTDFNSAFPAGINTAATFDKGLMYERGVAMGAEHRGKGVNVALGPMMNMGRAAAGGRNWEGFGGDPYLTGVASAETVKGVQSQGVIACAKHLIGKFHCSRNEQEHFRGGSGAQASSSNINDRTLHEIYAWPFAESIRAGVGSVMCSYNRINQTFACDNSKILNGLVKQELVFQGFIVSDWGGVESGVSSILAGTDLNMPGFFAYGDKDEKNPAIANNSYFGANLVTAVNNGSVPLTRVQDMVTRLMAAYYMMGQDQNYPQTNFNQVSLAAPLNEHVNVQGNHRSLIREIGAASTIMLKNKGYTLPLDVTAFRRWGVFGSDAGPNPDGPNSFVDRGGNQGTLAMGWGSGSVNFPYLIDPNSALSTYVHAHNPDAMYEAMMSDYNYAQVDIIAGQADICLVFANADSGEGYITVAGNAGDRNNLTLWHGGEALILSVASSCSNTVVVLHAVGPVIVESWIDHVNVTAVLQAGLPGQESGNSIVDVIFGAINPSGRLPYTIAKKQSDYSAQVLYKSNMTVPQINYSEELLIDYRWFDARGIAPRFEFGFGLSYSTFKFTGLSISKASGLSSTTPAQLKSVKYPNPGGPASLYAEAVSVSFSISNTSPFYGFEVPQLYLGYPASAGEPPKVFRGFERVALGNGASTQVTMNLNRKEISYWDVVTQQWVIPSGVFNIYVGQSSRIIRLQSTFSLS